MAMGGAPVTMHDSSMQDFFGSNDNGNQSVTEKLNNPGHSTRIPIATSAITANRKSHDHIKPATSIVSPHTCTNLDTSTEFFFYPFHTYKSFIAQFSRELVDNLFYQLRNMPLSYYHQMIADGYYPSTNNNKNKHHRQHRRKQKQKDKDKFEHCTKRHNHSYNLSIIELLCKIILFDYIGPISLSGYYTKFCYKRARKMTILQADKEQRKNIKVSKITSFYSTISATCALHCPNIIYNNNNSNPLCENRFGFIMFESRGYDTSIIASPLYIEMNPDTGDGDGDGDGGDWMKSKNKNKNKNKLILCYSDPKQYNRSNRMSIFPLQLPNMISQQSVGKTCQRYRKIVSGLNDNFRRYNCMILETFGVSYKNNKKENINGAGIESGGGGSGSGVRYCQYIILAWQKCSFYNDIVNRNGVCWSILPIMSNPNQFNPFTFSGSTIGIEIDDIDGYSWLKHLDKHGRFKSNNNNYNNNNISSKYTKSKTKKKGKTKSKSTKTQEHVEPWSIRGAEMSQKLAELGNIGETWAKELNVIFGDEKCVLLFKQGMFGLNFYINSNNNTDGKDGDVCNYNRGYWLVLSKKGILLWQLKFYGLSINDCNIERKFLIFASLPYGKMFGEYGDDATRDLIINYLRKINDKSIKKPLKHEIMQNYFYFSHFVAINDQLFDNNLNDFNNFDAAYDPKRNLLFSCVKIATFNLKILVYNNNNNNNSSTMIGNRNNNLNNNNNNKQNHNINTCSIVEPIDCDEDQKSQINMNKNENDKTINDNQNKTSSSGHRRRRRRGRSSKKKSNDNDTNTRSDVSYNAPSTTKTNQNTDASHNLIIVSCPLDSIPVAIKTDEKSVNVDIESDDLKSESNENNNNNNNSYNVDDPISFVLNFKYNKVSRSRAMLAGEEQMIMMFYSFKNDATYILTRQTIKVDVDESRHKYQVHLRLIELNNERILNMFEMYGMYVTFNQLINNGAIVIHKQKNLGNDLEWSNRSGHFVKRNAATHSCQFFREWIFNDNDNCIIGYGNYSFVMIPLCQLLFN